MTGHLNIDHGRGGGLFLVGVGGSDPYGYSVSVAGTLAPTTYLDGGGNTRTIRQVLYNTGTGFFSLTLSGNVADDDAAFRALVVNGVYLTRAGRSSYSFSTHSTWFWGISSPLGTSGTKVMQVLQ